MTPVTALSNASHCDILYIEAVRDFAADKPAAQQAALLSQYGRIPGGGNTGRGHGTRRSRSTAASPPPRGARASAAGAS